MTVNDSLQWVSKKLESIVKDNTQEIYNRITGIKKNDFLHEVVELFAEKKKKAVEEWYDNGQFDDEEVIDQEVMIRYNKAINDFMKLNWYDVDFEERVEWGKEVMVYTLNQKIKEFSMEINFNYTLEHSDTISEVDLAYSLNK